MLDKKTRPKSEMTTNSLPDLVPGVDASIRPTNIDEVVVDGKLFRKEGYTENGCSKFRLVEVK